MHIRFIRWSLKQWCRPLFESFIFVSNGRIFEEIDHDASS